jgi:D-alanyl-D-alanine carboxypeptidase
MRRIESGLARAASSKRLLVAALALFALCVAAAARAQLPEPVARALAQAAIPESAAAFYVHEIGAERPLLAAGADRPMNPASTIKLVIRGGGDPKLTIENFWLLLRGLRSRGVRDIRGDLVLDRSYFASEEYDPSRFDEQPTRPYNTGPDALLVNFKATRLQFVPDLEGRAVRVIAEPPLITTVQSPALSEIVRDINKFSNNVMARQLFLTLGAVGAGAPASPDKSSRVIRQWLAGKGLAFPALVLENGSGLSRHERITAGNLGQLLLAAFRSAVMPELIASLPVAAVDGTMKKRLSGAEVAGQAHIKTGSLSGVRAIAGYVLDAQGRRVAVVFIVNHANAGNAQIVQDALLRWVHHR